ncbi:MAG: hypothetical protein U1E62_22550 [Alsobacter sp.]
MPRYIDVLADPNAPFFEDNAYATVHIAATSDVRADEFFLAILADELRRGGLPDPVFRVADDERLIPVSVADTLDILHKGDAWHRVSELGHALGGFLRAVHDAGLLRGRGSVWMGNDIVGADGRLSAVDFDGGARDEAKSATILKRIEAADYAAGFADCYSWGQQDWLAEGATILTETFWEGYRRALNPSIQ